MVRRLLAMLCLGVSVAISQWSGYLSSTQGFNTNPLYNYAEQSDQLNQSYLELNLGLGEGLSRGRISYVGSLSLFNQLSDRNYYEQSLQGEYVLQYLEGNGETDDVGASGNRVVLGNTLTLQAKLGARHDKEVYNAYDNYGGSATASYRAMTSGKGFVLVSDEFGYRHYLNVPALSNILDIAQVRIGGTFARGFEGSFLALAGLKHFSGETIDTSTVEVATVSTSTGTGSGNGNGKGKGKVISGTGTPAQGSSKKKAIVVNPTSTNAFIVAVGGNVEAKWKSGSIGAEAIVRFNLSDSARYVAQFANTLGLGEDIYNDFFSYRGPEAKLLYTQMLPLGLSLRFSGEYAHRTFLAPAFDLEGLQVADNRVDIRTAGEVILSRSFELSDALSLDVMLTGAAVSSRSNDQYNDYSVQSVSLGVGLGF
jgi:hypothetical protein